MVNSVVSETQHFWNPDVILSWEMFAKVSRIHETAVFVNCVLYSSLCNHLIHSFQRRFSKARL